MVIRRICDKIGWLALASLCLGFRTMGDARWDISPENPTVWLDIDEALLNATFTDTKFADDSDPLKDVPKEQQAIELLKLVLNDYNSVATSFVRLQSYPGQIPDLDAPRDGDMVYDESYAATHTIRIVIADPSAAGAGGDASISISAGQITGCQIRARLEAIKSAGDAKVMLTHEIFHCLGFGHEHEDRESIMSYDSHKVTKLGIEEKMGLTHLYPKSGAFGDESATFGLACDPAGANSGR